MRLKIVKKIKTTSLHYKFNGSYQARQFVKIFGGSNLITKTFLAKSRKFRLHCLHLHLHYYIVDFVCNVRTSQ